ncbi:hypothetical protein PIB30_040331 [Stylosanthes scabra]|uniref:Replication factor A C-terminal domain-containing protein n=1 Tax=Stylosanthes scabra TaxID=79078 RepID=A0ABU6TFK8_9FABA|nr:hypothetical protein [Stylosanthes scabra]
MPQTLISSSKPSLLDSNTSSCRKGKGKGIPIPFFPRAFFNKRQDGTTIKQKLLSNVNSSAKKHYHYYPLEKDFLEITPRKTIGELKECKEDGDYAVYGTIKGVIGGPDWFVAKCRCDTEVVLKFGSYYCEKCSKHVKNIIPRYRIKVEVFDPSGSATFVIFENLGCLLLHKSCTEILKSTENGDYDLTQLSEFQSMLSDRSFIFEVKKNCFTPPKEPAYDVVDICFNDSIITKFKERDPLFYYTQDLMSQYNNVDVSQQCQSEK